MYSQLPSVTMSLYVDTVLIANVSSSVGLSNLANLVAIGYGSSFPNTAVALAYSGGLSQVAYWNTNALNSSIISLMYSIATS